MGTAHSLRDMGESITSQQVGQSLIYCCDESRPLIDQSCQQLDHARAQPDFFISRFGTINPTFGSERRSTTFPGAFKQAERTHIVINNHVRVVRRCVDPTIRFHNVDTKGCLMRHVGQTLRNDFSPLILQPIVDDNGLHRYDIYDSQIQKLCKRHAKHRLIMLA